MKALRRAFLFFTGLLIFFSIVVSFAATITVPGDYTTIQVAIDAATHGDEIIVSPGTYLENINFNGKNVTLRSLDPSNPDVVSSTVIDGNTSGSVVTFSGSEHEACLLSGFTITHGYAMSGGGIKGKGTLATIRHNTIMANEVHGGWPEGSGGGVSDCDGIIEYNTISGNSAIYGGGLFGCDGAIQHNTIVFNETGKWGLGGFGGGLYWCNGNVHDNVISDNKVATWGGGLMSCHGTIQGNTICNNSALRGGGLYECHGTIRDNTIEENRASADVSYGSQGGGLCDCDGTVHYNTIRGNNSHMGGGLYGCDGSVRYNIISGNTANHGAGLYLCHGALSNNTIAENLARYRGGGLNECHGLIQNNTVFGNFAWYGGGLYQCSGTIQHNSVVSNVAPHGAALYECRGLIANCIIWENVAYDEDYLHECSTPFYCCIQEWSGVGVGNISTDPLFVDLLNDDYHLLPGSPCIDTGYNYYLYGEYIADIDGECRLAGGFVDMGSDEYGSSTDTDGDLSADVNEASQGSSPHNPDTDGDSLIDGVEVIRGTNPNVQDTPPGIVILSLYSSVQQGVFLAFSGEVITLAEGAYYENLHLLGKHVTLQSGDPLNAEVMAATIIDGQKLSSVILFDGSEDETCLLRGLTIQNGSAYYGGGIRGNGTLATVVDNKIIYNSARYGGGIYQCDGTIENNEITNNSAIGNASCAGGALNDCDGTVADNFIASNLASGDVFAYGGGLSECDGTIQHNMIFGNAASGGTSSRGGALSRCDGSIVDNLIAENTATVGGGLRECHGTIQKNGIYNNSALRQAGALYNCHGTITHNRISSNSAGEEGGGLFSCNGPLLNNIIAENAAPYGGGLTQCGGISNSVIWGNSASEIGGGLYECYYASISNCIIWGNEAPVGDQLHSSAVPSFCCIQDWTGGGTGNISSDPLFVDLANNDFRLLDSSPCIDAGDSAPEFNDACRPPGKGSERNDMGAYGGPLNCIWLQVHHSDFDGTFDHWQFHTLTPTSAHPEPWQNASQTPDTYSLSLFSPYDESTNYFAFWDSSDAALLPCCPESLYRVDWLFSTDRSQPDFAPSFRFRIGLQNQKAFSCSRLYPGGWLPLAQRPEATPYQLFFQSPIPDQSLDLAFSLIDWTDDFRQTSPAGVIFLEELSIYRYGLSEFSEWQEEVTFSPSDLSSWSTVTLPFYDAPTFAQSSEGLSLNSGIHASRVFGSWTSPLSLFIVEPSKVYRLRSNVSADPQRGGPHLRLRVHTDDYRYSWTSSYASSYTEGESALPPETGAEYDLYMTLPFSSQPCRVSFDLVDFSTTFGGTLSLHSLSLHSQPFE